MGDIQKTIFFCINYLKDFYNILLKYNLIKKNMFIYIDIHIYINIILTLLYGVFYNILKHFLH